jgi:peptidoglycan/LPS O-acetylase OafA/YrhL
MSQKKRLFYLDFIRALATLLVVIVHYNALFLYWQPQIPNGGVFVTFFSNIYIGDLGVSLFFIISGAALMYVYGDKRIDYLQFEKKRLLSLYPMYWIAYAITFILKYEQNSGLWIHTANWKWILTIFGFDGLVSTTGASTYYLLGEWFLGFIILIYLLFPILKWGLNQYFKFTVAIVMCLYAVTVLFYDGMMPSSVILTTRLPEFLFGMIFVTKIKKINLSSFLCSLVLVIGNGILKPELNGSLNNIQVTYVGISCFLILVYISKWLDHGIIKRSTNFISKYSYPIFLVHHVIIYQYMSGLDLFTFGLKQDYYYFIKILVISFIFAYVLYQFDAWWRAILVKSRGNRNGFWNRKTK